jgi:Ca2+-binding RTX toxin-like protein
VSYNEGKADDANADDTYVLIGASVKTGAGDDTISATTLAEATSIEAGVGNDTLNVQLTGTGVLAGDTNANSTAVVTALGVDLREVTAADATKQDALGAVIDLGEGDDTANFLDTLAVTAEATTIVAADAELRGGAGNDVLNVTTLDAVTVTAPIAATITSGVAAQTDTNANVTGFEAANFTIANQITNAGDTKLNDGTVVAADAAYAATGALANTRNENYVGSPTINDDDATGASVTADMARFDSALKSVNLVSQEQPLLMVNQQYEAGTATSFVLNNLGAGVTVSLQAQEATGVTSGALKDDTTTDVNLTVNLGAAAARGLADALTLNLASGSGAFDLNLTVNKTNVDNVGSSASTTDDDTMLVEKLTIGLAADDKGHAIVMSGGFGDANYTGYAANVGTYAQFRNQAGNNDKSVTDYNAATAAQKGGQGNAAATEFTLGSATAGTVAGTTTSVTGLSADKITLNGAGVVNMTVNATNNYTIVSGTGADTINMVADTVDDEDAIDGGATGRNTLVISGSNSIGFATASQPENDDAWTNKKNLQILEIRSNAAGANANTVVLDEQTFVTGIDTINLTATTKDVSNQTTTIVFGDDFRRDTAITTTDDIVSTQVNITNRVSATDTNQSISLFANGGAGVTLNDLYGRSKLTATVALNDAGGATTIASTAVAATDGNVDLDVAAGTTGTISSITLVDNNQSATGKAAGTSLDAGAISVTVNNAWSRTTFTVDASAITNTVVSGGTAAQTETALADGGLTFDGAAETDATLTVRGTQNSDDITGGAGADTLAGNAGNDVVRGGLGADSITGDAGNDTLLGEAGADVVDGGAGNDAITGGTGADALTGGTGTDIFNYSDVTQSTGAAADVISDFASGTDKISITATVAGASTVNLGRFSNNGDNTSLDGNNAALVLFDGYYGNGSLAIDVNGDGQINDNLDYSIKSTAAIAAGDVNYTLTIGNGNNVVRMGQGVDVVTAGTGDDTFVIVGSISATQAAAYAAAGAGVVPAALSKVLPFADLTTARTASEAQSGDKITAGTGTDTLHLYGQVDMTVFSNADGSSTIIGFENLIINSDITLTPSQLANVGKLTFNGDSAHVLKIVQPAVGTTAAKVFTPAEVTTFLTGGSVTGITSLSAAIPVEVTNAGVNTTLTLGTATAAAPTTTRTVSEFVADTGLKVQNATDVVTGYTAAQVNKVISNLSSYADNGITGVLSFSTDITNANLTTLLNSAKVDNTKTSVAGTTGNDTIDLSNVTRGLSIDGGAGNDTITTTKAADTVSASAGNDTIILTAATTGTVSSLTGTIALTNVDRITGFGSGDTLQLPFVPTAVSSTTASGTTIAVIKGTVSGTNFTVSSTGTDMLFVFDQDGTGTGTTTAAVVLVGYNPTTTGATGGTGSTGTFGG